MATRPDPSRDGSGRDESVAGWPLGRLLSTAARLIEQDWNAVLADHGLTHAGLVALAALQDGPLTQRELAAASRVEQQTMSRILDRLERTGHVVRARDLADGRRRVVTLTASGRRTLAVVTRSGVADRLVSERVQDVDRFRAELERLVQSARGEPAGGQP